MCLRASGWGDVQSPAKLSINTHSHVNVAHKIAGEGQNKRWRCVKCIEVQVGCLCGGGNTLESDPTELPEARHTRSPRNPPVFVAHCAPRYLTYLAPLSQGTC